MSVKQYVDLSGITVYDEEIKDYIGSQTVELTYQQYQNLPSSKETDNVNYFIKDLDPEATKGIVLTGTLSAGSTSLILNNSVIKSDSMIDFYTTVYGINPTNVVQSNSSITFTFEEQSVDIGVVAIVWNSDKTHPTPFSVTVLPTATEVTYNNSTSGLTATNTQSAIDELANSSGGAISELNDVTLTSLANNQILLYNSTSQKWVNSNLPSSDSYSNTVSCSVGATDVTFTDVTYSNTATYVVYGDDGTGRGVPIAQIWYDSNNKVKATFVKPLLNATTCYLKYWER